MSVEEDTELRDLVSQTLETNGCLAKIRAQLRASIFLALDEDECLQKKEPFLNVKVKNQLESQQGRLMFCLVREFLEFFNLEFTISVYEPESYSGSQYTYEGRNRIVQDLNISLLDEKSTSPLLLQLIQIAQSTAAATVSTHEHHKNSFSEKYAANSDSKSESSNTTGGAEHSIKTEVSGKALPNTNKLNETFDLTESRHSSIVLQNNSNNKTDAPTEAVSISPPRVITDPIEKDDTFEGTSSIAADDGSLIRETTQDENTRNLIDLDKSTESEKSKLSSSDSEFSPPVVRDGKFSKFDSSFEKPKLSPQKSKAKGGLSDLPPLPAMNKSRCNEMLLPSLYSREFKDKSNCKDVEKMFVLNSLDNYEEDFMSGSEADLVQKRTETSDVEKSNKLDSEASSLVNNNGGEGDRKDRRELSDSVASSITSEDFEFNSNVEDILNLS